MKSTTLKTLLLLGIPLMTTLPVAAQEQTKVKVNDNEYKYKSEDQKLKVQKEETKYKSADLKIKANENETKIKGKVRPARPFTTEQTEMKTGESRVMTKEHIQPIGTAEPATTTPTPATIEQVDVPKTATTVKKSATTRNYAATKRTPQKRTTARKTNAAPKYIVRTKVVKDTVFVPSPPERIVSTQTEYVRDTVLITRVDTVVKTQTTNTNSGYNVPAGDFKKVKLKKDKDGEVHMKRKE